MKTDVYFFLFLTTCEIQRERRELRGYREREYIYREREKRERERAKWERKRRE